MSMTYNVAAEIRTSATDGRAGGDRDLFATGLGFKQARAVLKERADYMRGHGFKVKRESGSVFVTNPLTGNLEVRYFLSVPQGTDDATESGAVSKTSGCESPQGPPK